MINKWGQWGYYNGQIMTLEPADLIKQDMKKQTSEPMEDNSVENKEEVDAEIPHEKPEQLGRALAPVYVIDGVQCYSTRPMTPVVPRSHKTSKTCMLPHWVIYIAWTLVVLTMLASALFLFLYSVEWGKEKSEEWMTTFFLSFFQSVLVVQPLKVLQLDLCC